MKRILLTIALVAFAFSANAQWVLGGNVAFNHNGTATEGLYEAATTSFSLQPKAGYRLNKQMQVGLQAGPSYLYTRTYDDTGDNEDYSSSTRFIWQVAPYFRYNMVSWQNFTIFAEAKVGMTFAPKSSWYNNTTGAEGDDNTSSFGLTFNVVPGLNYALTKHFSIDAYVDLLGLYYNYTATTVTNALGTETTSTSHSYGLLADMDARPLIGYTSEDIGPTTIMTGLEGHLTLIRIGFNYCF
ncbi:MAG: outer membrane beta-barrel protein [Bacteroidales bacterium]|nr:outer membrane beta-barrel protein [Bacteroidales bacterium]